MLYMQSTKRPCLTPAVGLGNKGNLAENHGCDNEKEGLLFH